MSDIILLILEILQRAALIMGVIYALDLAHNGKFDLYHPKIRRLKKGIIYRFFLKIAEKLESRREAITRAWDWRTRKMINQEVEFVICFHCGKEVTKDEAFYIKDYDTYLCPKHYLDLLEGKPIKLSNWKRRGV